jgi:cytochrome c biogenesis protein CcmG, thiol:disulfide interchange protein DsbE
MYSISPVCSSTSSSWLKRIVRAAVDMTTVMAVGCLALGLQLSSAEAAPALNEAAPPLVATTLDGQTFDLAKLRGKVVLVNFWATWCAPCRREMPILDAFYRRYREQGLELIGISVDFARDGAKMRKAAGAVTYPTAMANDIPVNGFRPLEGVPVTYVVDAEGVVRDMFIATPNKLLHGVVVPLLPTEPEGFR